MQTWTWSRRLTLIFMAKKKSCRAAARSRKFAPALDCAPTRRASAGLCPRQLSSGWARLQTDPQHTLPPLPLLRSRSGGVRGASVVRSLKPDKFSRSSLKPSALSGQLSALDFNSLRVRPQPTDAPCSVSVQSSSFSLCSLEGHKLKLEL